MTSSSGCATIIAILRFENFDLIKIFDRLMANTTVTKKKAVKAVKSKIDMLFILINYKQRYYYTNLAMASSEINLQNCHI